jgi:hypothetical protein
MILSVAIELASRKVYRRLAKTLATLMWSFLVVAPDPFIEIGLQGFDRSVELLAERDTVELVEDRLVKALDNAIRLWALRLGPRMVDVIHREIGCDSGAVLYA